MQDSEEAGGLIARAANRFLGKADREAASVLSNAQRHTHFLDSPRIAKCLARSDFAFSDLRHRITSVFLVLPPNRMDAYSRWLRLLVSQALQDIARDAEALTATTDAQNASQRLNRWSGCRPPQTASQCAKVVVLKATQRGGRRDEGYDDRGRSGKECFSSSWGAAHGGDSVSQEADANAVSRVHG
jgi:hypothetical protein